MEELWVINEVSDAELCFVLFLKINCVCFHCGRLRYSKQKIKTPGFLCEHQKPQPTIHPRQWVHFSGPFFLSPLKLIARWLNRVQSSRNLKIQHCSAALSFTQWEHEWKLCSLIGFSEVCWLLNSKTWKMFIVILPLSNLNKLHLAGEDRLKGMVYWSIGYKVPIFHQIR